jgi:hypothetical protein
VPTTEAAAGVSRKRSPSSAATDAYAASQWSAARPAMNHTAIVDTA